VCERHSEESVLMKIRVVDLAVPSDRTAVKMTVGTEED
jgi:hypothetical protein